MLAYNKLHSHKWCKSSNSDTLSSAHFDAHTRTNHLCDSANPYNTSQNTQNFWSFLQPNL